MIEPTPVAYREIDFSWMIGRSVSVEFHDSASWFFILDSGAVITVECLWRLVVNGRIVCCSEDHGHQFGLPAPVDAAEICRTILAGQKIASVHLREATADLSIQFTGEVALEIIPNSLGYESWHLTAQSGREYVASGAGRIFTWVNPRTPP